MKNKKYWWSNCFFEAMKAKIKFGKQIKLIHIPAYRSTVFCPHWMWHDLRQNTICDFDNAPNSNFKWYNQYLFKGYIRVMPYAAFERWQKSYNKKKG